jgi:hypothetical protein
MAARYLLSSVVFACSVLAGGAQAIDIADLKTIVGEATVALKSPVSPRQVAEDLRSRTYRKQIRLTDVCVTELRDLDVLAITAARRFAGLYTLDGQDYPDPSSLDAQRVADDLRRIMRHATWRPHPDRISCSGAGLVVLALKRDGMTFTYSLLASTYTFRRLRFGQLVSVEATISGVSMKEGHLEIFGAITQVQEP